jgi:hypothetical protein
MLAEWAYLGWRMLAEGAAYLSWRMLPVIRAARSSAR